MKPMDPSDGNIAPAARSPDEAERYAREMRPASSARPGSCS